MKSNKQFQKEFKDIVNDHAFEIYEWVINSKNDEGKKVKEEFWQDILHRIRDARMNRVVLKNIRCKTNLGDILTYNYNKNALDRKNREKITTKYMILYVD